MTKGGYVVLVFLLMCTGFGLYYFMASSPLGRGASDAKLMQALDNQKTQAALRATTSRDVVTEEDL